jgi:hypothetical protein
LGSPLGVLITFKVSFYLVVLGASRNLIFSTTAAYEFLWSEVFVQGPGSSYYGNLLSQPAAISCIPLKE